MTICEQCRCIIDADEPDDTEWELCPNCAIEKCDIWEEDDVSIQGHSQQMIHRSHECQVNTDKVHECLRMFLRMQFDDLKLMADCLSLCPDHYNTHAKRAIGVLVAIELSLHLEKREIDTLWLMAQSEEEACFNFTQLPKK